MQIDIMDTVLAAIQNEIDSKYQGIFTHINGLPAEFEQLLVHWKQESEQVLQADDPFAKHADLLKAWQQAKGTNDLNQRMRICKHNKSEKQSDSQKHQAKESGINAIAQHISISELNSIDIGDLNRLIIGDYQKFSKFSRTPFELEFWQKELLPEISFEYNIIAEQYLEEDFLLEMPFKGRAKKKKHITDQFWLFGYEFEQDEEDDSKYNNKENSKEGNKDDNRYDNNENNKDDNKEDSEAGSKDDNKDDSHENNKDDNKKDNKAGSKRGNKDASRAECHLECIDNQNSQISRQLLLNDWQKNLDEVQSAWKLETLQQLSQEFLGKFEDWLNALAHLQEILEKLGLESKVWLNFSEAELKPEQIEQLKFWAEYLAKDVDAQAICKLLGSLTQATKSEHTEKFEQALALAPYINACSKDEIVGLKLGNDMENVLPSELALLSDPNTSILFDLKFLESSLLCFKLEGISLEQKQQGNDAEQSQCKDEKQGPMILCIDTSGSMYGEPEHLAKAMALYLATQAKEQGRECYLINFSIDIETYELTGKEGLSSLINFLGNSFYDDTDIAPALRHALLVMSQKEYKKADVLVISDFIMDILPADILNDINVARNNGNAFNSLVIGDCFIDESMQTYFDHEWVYNPKTSKIQELVQFKQAMLEN